MVLDYSKAKELLSNIKHPSDYLVLDIKHFIYGEEREKLENSIKILNLINTILRANEVYEDIGVKTRIDPSILYEAVSAVMETKKFSKDQLERYYKCQQEVESYYMSIIKIIEMDIYIPEEVEYILLGIEEKVSKLERDNRCKFSDDFCKLLCDLRFEGISTKKFIEEVNKRIEQFDVVKTENQEKSSSN